MEKYKVLTESVNFPSGSSIGLTKDQFKRRKHLLKLVSNDVYIVLRKVTFKKGEVVLLNGIDKASASRLELVDKPKKDKQDKPKK